MASQYVRLNNTPQCQPGHWHCILLNQPHICTD